jgi:hypothetical protein
VLDADRFKLLGTYHTPRFRYGRRVQCQVRGNVTIVGLTDARISWPVCSGVGESSGRTSLAVYKDLARAVRRESAQAIAHWWGVSVQTVSKWRKVLGVEQNNTGTRRLRQEYAFEPGQTAGRLKGQAKARDPQRNRKIAESLRGKPKPPGAMQALHEGNRGRKASKKPRRKMSEAHRRRGTRPPSAGRAWEPWEDAWISLQPAEEVARRTGQTVNAVRQRRCLLGIPNRFDGRRGKT